MRGAQRSSLTNWDALLLRLRGGLTGARAHPKPGKRLSRCLADLGPTETPPLRGQLDGWMDGWGGKSRDAAEQIWPSPSPSASSWPGGAAHALRGRILAGYLEG